MLHNQNQLVPHKALINNITRKGAGFAGTEDGESIFISVRLMEQFNLDVGDAITCWCADQYTAEQSDEDRPSARWKAMRLKVDRRLSDALGNDIIPTEQNAAPPLQPAVYVAPDKASMSPAMLREKVMLLMQKPRCWTARQLADEITMLYRDDYVIPEEVTQKVSAMMYSEHLQGNVASCRVMKISTQEKASSVYYARSTEIFDDLLDGYEVDE